MPVSSEIKGNVCNIQRFTVHDGPGIRTEVFLSGCPLKCPWCSNPESQDRKPVIGLKPDNCIGIDKCGYCLDICPEIDNGALVAKNNRISGIDRDICTVCLKCVDACPSINTFKVWGRQMTIREVMAIVMSDRKYYENSGGGITVSGGEPLFQWEYTQVLLQESKRLGINTCLESTLHCNSDILDRVFPYVDLVISDIKHMDSKEHNKLVGVSNKTILKNLKYTIRSGMSLVIRLPVVMGYNDSREAMIAAACFIANELENKVKQVQLIPFRQLGLEKYNYLEKPYPMADYDTPDRATWEKNIESLVELMKPYGIPVVAGTSNKINL